MRRFLREFFFLRKGERRTLIVVLIGLLVTGVTRLWIATKPMSEPVSDPYFRTEMQKLQEKLRVNSGRVAMPETGDAKMIPVREPLAPFVFDPNRITYDSLLKMNLSEYVSRNIIRYREAGGKFTRPGDLSRIYGLEAADLETLLPYIQLQEESGFQKEKHEAGQAPVPVIELNTADTLLLKLLPGIGTTFARRITGYRDLLGGFHDISQLWEVYGMDSLRFGILLENCMIDTGKLRRINLNSASFPELLAHPYISRPECYAIIQYRQFRDSLIEKNELEKNQIIEHERFKRMAPYLSSGI